ncbi:GMC family oxidoreductase [Serinicoccus hydrothermalis]|uniref:GMC family oxidoreductase n=1 Tax=Serinicoccus hydrothermalis TaxID=1758689 RepID=UPI0008323974|nr:GMC family oxidoreductase N-terminal domain-containing protein [Serinicoccus hydrothermalis]
MSAEEAFDVVVVGAGSAGAVVAHRLTSDGSRRVLLLEAGGRDRSPDIHIPAAFSRLFESSADWNYRTTPQPGLAGRSIYWPRGKVLGGSSSLNAMMWVPGFAADYDRWAQLAGPTWGPDEVAPLLESTLVSVEDQRDPSPLTDRLLRAAAEAGYAVEEANPHAPDGFARTRVTQRRGARSSTARAYLKPAAGRQNLEVRTGAHVTRVLLEGRVATGVEYAVGGVTRTATARQAVVLCGGAVNTPQLLMLSGIGARDELQEHGIPVVVDAPEVGKNLRDHLVSGLIPRTSADTLASATSVANLARYLLRRRGMLTSNVAEAYGFVRSRPELAEPDLELIWAPVAYADEGLHGIPEHGLTLGPILLQPESRGTIALASVDPFAHPVIDPRYLSDPEGADRATMLAGLAIAQRILDSPALRAVTDGTFVRPVEGEKISPTERAVVALEQHAHTLYHPTSTARMGSDPDSVVDPELRVRGVERLLVADASVMPEIIRGHTHAPSVVIGERAAKLLQA